MAHASINNPVGDYFEGLVPGIDNLGIQYVYRLYGRSQPNNPIQGTHRFLTTVLADVRVGVNTLFPSQRIEIVDNASQQLRLTNTQNITTPGNSIRTDFQTTAAGDLFINPSNAGTDRRIGINTAAPTNTLEIKTQGAVISNTGAGSGLRFTNMNNTVAPQNNPDPQSGVLSVDANGDVIFVTDQGGGGGGTGDVLACTSVGGIDANFITKWTPVTNEICKSGIWEDPISQNNVGIGTTTPAAKLGVAGNINMLDIGGWDAYMIAGHKFLSVAGDGSNVIIGQFAGNAAIAAATTPLAACTFVGQFAGAATVADGEQNSFFGTYAGTGVTTGDRNVFAGYTAGADFTTASDNTCIGYAAGRNINGSGNVIISSGTGPAVMQTTNSNTFIGAGSGSLNTGSNNTCLGAVSDIGAGLNFATAIGAGAFVNSSNTIAIGRIGDQTVIGGSSPHGTNTLSVLGEAYKNNGNPEWIIVADDNLERDVSSFTDGLNVIRNVNPINFAYESNNLHSDSSENIIGVSGVEMALVAPYTIDTMMAQLDSASAVLSPVLTFNRNGLFYALLNAVKELDSTDQARTVQVNQLQSQLLDFTTQLIQLQTIVDSCCSRGHGHGHGHDLRSSDEESGNRIDVNLSNTKTIILNQNVPNPFAEQTTINYFLPDDVIKAQIIFYNNQGNVLRIVELNEKGKGELNVFAADLSSGIYTYTLIADGKVIETKKMIKQ